MSRHLAEPKPTGPRIKHGLYVFFVYALLFVGAVIVGWGLAYTIMQGLWWVVFALAIVLAPPTAWSVHTLQKRRRYNEGSKVVIERYTRGR